MNYQKLEAKAKKQATRIKELVTGLKGPLSFTGDQFNFLFVVAEEYAVAIQFERIQEVFKKVGYTVTDVFGTDNLDQKRNKLIITLAEPLKQADVETLNVFLNAKTDYPEAIFEYKVYPRKKQVVIILEEYFELSEVNAPRAFWEEQ